MLPEYVLYNDISLMAKNYIKYVLTIDKKFIIKVASNYYEDKTSNIIQNKHQAEVKSQIVFGATAKIPSSKNESNSISRVIEKDDDRFKTKTAEVKASAGLVSRGNSRSVYGDGKKEDYNYFF